MFRSSKPYVFALTFLVLIHSSLCYSQIIYSTNNNYILKNSEPFIIKGVVYVPSYPGFLPYEIALEKELPKALQQNIKNDIQNINNMGANTIRLWDTPEFVYEVLKDYPSLSIIQTIWFPVDQDDFQDQDFKNQCKNIILGHMNRIYSVYSKETPPNILAYLIGNELSQKSIQNTNAQHPNLNSYEGLYVSAPQGSNATECFLAEMADFLKHYEYEMVQQNHLVSYANEIRTYQLIDTPFLDFRCHNVYSNSISDYASPKFGSFTQTLFQGWIEFLKNTHSDRPLLITETGLSVSPNATHTGPPDYGYGGNTEEEQAQALVQFWNDVQTSSHPVAGMVIHEYLDAWWKFSIPDSLTQDPNDVEEWFGLVAIEKDESSVSTHFRPAYYQIKKIWQN